MGDLSHNEIASIVVNTGLDIHRELGPGLLESVYELILAKELQKTGLVVQRQLPVDFTFRGTRFENGFRIDLLVNNMVVIELKSVRTIDDIHLKQLRTYLVLADKQLGLLINFGGALFRDGVRRVVNGLTDEAATSAP